MSLSMPAYIGIYIFAVNLLDFILCGMDKRRAKLDQWRIPEATLLFIGLMGGCFGLLLGMRVFHHKTKRLKFTILVPLECILWIAGVIYLIFSDKTSSSIFRSCLFMLNKFVI